MDKYIQWTGWIRDEIIESMTQEQKDLVEADLRSMGEDAWLSWIGEHIDEACEYVEATEVQRSRREAWRDNPVHRLRIALCACLILPRAMRMINDSVGIALPGSKYRAHAARACAFWVETYFAKSPFWPFDEDDQFCGFDR